MIFYASLRWYRPTIIRSFLFSGHERRFGDQLNLRLFFLFFSGYTQIGSKYTDPADRNLYICRLNWDDVNVISSWQSSV